MPDGVTFLTQAFCAHPPFPLHVIQHAWGKDWMEEVSAYILNHNRSKKSNDNIADKPKMELPLLL